MYLEKAKKYLIIWNGESVKTLFPHYKFITTPMTSCMLRGCYFTIICQGKGRREKPCKKLIRWKQIIAFRSSPEHETNFTGKQKEGI